MNEGTGTGKTDFSASAGIFSFRQQTAFYDDITGVDSSICEWTRRNDLSKSGAFHFRMFLETAQNTLRLSGLRNYEFYFLIFRKFRHFSASRKLDLWYMRKERILPWLGEKYGIRPHSSISAREVRVGNPETDHFAWYVLLPLENAWLERLHELEPFIRIFACPHETVPLLKDALSEQLPDFILSDESTWDMRFRISRGLQTAVLLHDAMVFATRFCTTDWPELSLLGLAKTEIVKACLRCGNADMA